MIKLLPIKKIVTVDVIYFRPDFRTILQEFIWTTEDVVPELLRVHKFLNFWKVNIQAVISEVNVCISDSKQWRRVDHII